MTVAIGNIAKSQTNKPEALEEILNAEINKENSEILVSYNCLLPKKTSKWKPMKKYQVELKKGNYHLGIITSKKANNGYGIMKIYSMQNGEIVKQLRNKTFKKPVFSNFSISDEGQYVITISFTNGKKGKAYAAIYQKKK